MSRANDSIARREIVESSVEYGMRSQENTDEIYEREFLEKAIAATKLKEEEKAFAKKNAVDNGDDQSVTVSEMESDESRLSQFYEPPVDAEQRAEFFRMQSGSTLKQKIRKRSVIALALKHKESTHSLLKYKDGAESQKLVSEHHDNLEPFDEDDENLFTTRKFMNNPHPNSMGSKEDPIAISESWKSHPMAAMIKSSASDSNKEKQSFIDLWVKFILATHTYNFFTAFFYLGIAGFPTGIWFVIEASAEIIVLCDFVYREVMRTRFPEVWKSMQMIHDSSATNSRLVLALALIACIPQSIILNYALLGDQTSLSMLPIAFARCFKLFQMRHVQRYFAVMDLKYRRVSSESIVKTAQVVYYLTIFIHWVTCLWLLVNRIDPEVPESGWYKMDHLEWPHSPWEEYCDSFFWVHSQMSGSGFGNVVPSTILEWFVTICVEVFGASIFFGLYSDLAVEVYMRNQIAIENQKMAEDAKQFVLIRKIPEDIAIRIKQYYQFMRVQFNVFQTKQDTLAELPASIKSELTLIFNSQLIQSVNFFQLADPAFILSLTMKCYPQICILGDFVFKADDMADNLFFILQGQVEILAPDNETPLAYQSKGSYFGEIGVLLTGVRTASVRIIITSILFYIEKNELIAILDNYPKQAKFLRAVGRQRLKNVDKKARGLDEAVQALQRTHSSQDLMGDKSEMYQEKNQAIKRLGSLNMISPEDEEKEFLDQKLKTKTKSQNNKNKSMSHSKTKPWLTSRSAQVDFFVIVPYSLIFNVWNTILVGAVTFFTFIVPYNCVLEQDINQYANVTCQIIFLMDMPLRALTAVTKTKSIILDKTELLKYYVNKWLVIDFVATVPLDLILLPLGMPEVIRWIMLLKLFKLLRIQELSQILKHNGSMNGSVATLGQLFFYFLIAAHFMACGMVYVGLLEYNRCSRFDCKTLFWSINANSFTIQGPVETLSPAELYGQMWYYCGDLIMCACFGDIVPYVPNEQILVSSVMLVGRILVAFVCAEFASYLEGQYAAIEEYTTKVNFIKRWMAKSGFPNSLITRVIRFHSQMWKDFRGVNDQQILNDLPQTLRVEIRNVLFGSILKNWEVLREIENQGIHTALISKFELAVYPKDEYIIRINEIAQEMYFIIQGKVSVINAEGANLFTLEKGKLFGEMALLDQASNSRRGASIKSASKVTLAVLKLKDFQLICSIYPEFDAKIKTIVAERKIKAVVTQKVGKNILGKLQLNFGMQRPADLSVVKEQTVSVEGSDDGKQKKKSTLPIVVAPMPPDLMLRVSPKRNKSSNDIIGQMYITPEALKVNKIMTTVTPRSQETENQSTNSQMSLLKTLKAKQLSLIENQLRNKFGQDQPADAPNLGSKTLANHFTTQTKTGEVLRKCKKKCNRQNWMRVIITVLSFYNLIFVPMQFGFRIKYSHEILFMEIITIFFYVLDGWIRYKNLKKINWILLQDKNELTPKDQKIFDLHNEQLNEIRKAEQVEIVSSIFASVPFACLFSAYDYWEPWYIVDFYCSLRLVKIKPIFVLFAYGRSRNLNVWRAIEVIFYYYVITHYWSCIMVSCSAYEPDTNRTWLQKVPFPPAQNALSPPQRDFFAVNSFWTAYVNAFYFMASSFSHVNIGDISPISLMEKICMPFIMIFGTFMYYLLYSNIVAMVASLTAGNKLKFESEYALLRQKLNNGKTPQREIDNVNQYLDYILAIYDGLDEQQFLAELPFSIKSDILLSRFQEAIEKSILFIDDNGFIDITLSNSAFSMMKIKFYMKDQFIVKLGEHTTDTVIVLDGKVNVFGCHNNEFLGYLSAGYHFDNDLRNNFVKRNYHGHLGSGRLQLNLEPGDKLDSKSVVHLVAKEFVVVGVLTEEARTYLYNAYPLWKKRMQCVNYFLFDLGQLSLEKATEKAQRKISRQQCLTVLENNITYSTQIMYETFLAEFSRLRIDFDTDLSKSIRDFFLMEYFEVDDDHNRLMDKMKIIASMSNMNNQNPAGAGETSKKIDFNKDGEEKNKFKCALELKTNLMQCLQLIQFINLLYCAFLIPFQIGFNLEMTTFFVYIEGCSLLISLFFFFLTFRIPVIIHREKTLDCKKLGLHYWEKDMLFDLLGLSPLNLVLGMYFNNTLKTEWWVIFIAILRMTRVVQCVKMIEIFRNFQAHFKIPELITDMFKTFLVFMMLNHLAVCGWMYLLFVLEPDEPQTWLTVMGLSDASTAVKYLRSFYLVQNIVTTTGSGDCYACTDLERVFFIGLITGGDILFSLAFGFIQNLSRMSASYSEDKQFIDKIVRIESYMDEYKMSSQQKKRVEEYFAYAFVQKTKLTMLDREHLFQKLPTCLAKEIFYHNFREDLNKMFEEFGSENFIRDLCSKLNVLIYLPGDYVIERGTIGKEMYFVCDGLVNQIATDNKTWVGRFFVGDYFGELGILFETQRTIQMQAQTFCLLNELKKADLDEVSKSYPKVAEGLKSLAQEKLLMIDNFKNLNNSERNELKFGGVIAKSQDDSNSQEQGTFDFEGSLISNSRNSRKNIQTNAERGLLIQDQSNEDSKDFSEDVKNTLDLDDELLGIQKPEVTVKDLNEFQVAKKKQRRLSGISLGKTLKLSQKTGLKLHWAIDN